LWGWWRWLYTTGGDRGYCLFERGSGQAAVFLDDDEDETDDEDDRPLRDTATDALVVAAVEEPLGLKKS
jgi:hypothetical protein